MFVSKQFLWLVATTIFLALLAGCSGGSSSGSTSATLTSIAVTPASPTISLNGTQQFTATGTYSDSSTQPLTSSVTWSSNNAAVTISTGGLATGVTGSSTATITATSGAISGTASITVSAGPGAGATLTTITVSSNTTSVAKGGTLQFTATGHYSDATTSDLTNTTTWTSSNNGVATIASGGMATGVAWSGGGDITITATSGAISGTKNLSVTPKLESIAVTSALPSITQYTTQQFIATGTYSDNTTRDLTETTTWSANNSVVTINSTTGLATAGVSTGAFTITATSGAISGAKSMGVAAILSAPQGSAGSPLAITMPYNQGQIGTTNLISYYDYLAIVPISTITLTNASSATTQFTVQIYNESGFTSLRGGWSCSPVSGVSPVTCSGVTNPIGTSSYGYIKITHYTVGDNAPTSFTLDIPPASISLTPTTPTIPNSSTQQFTATGTYVGGTPLSLTAKSAWSSSNIAVATINRNGLASGVAVGGPATIAASYAGVSVATTLSVNNATLTAIAIAPATPTIANAATQQFTATGTYSDASTVDLTTSVTWTTSNPSIATINSAGLATGVAVGGPITITATLGGISNSATLQVN